MNKRGNCDIESNGEVHLAESESFSLTLGFQDSNAVSGRVGSHSNRQSMYKAATKGDWAAAEKLLSRDPSLAFEELSEEGDRALHVAVYSNKNTNLVRQIVNCVDPSVLELQDGRGYSACCYAARTGAVDAVDIMMKKNANLGSKRNSHGTTPLQLAVFYGNTKLALQFLRAAQLDDLLEQEWVDLLLLTMNSKMYDVALKILEKDRSLAVKKGVDQLTPLHVLAKLDLSEKERHDLREFAVMLWSEVLKLGRDNVVEFITNPLILHDAAKAGNVEILILITLTYPDLLGLTNDEGHSIYHIGVMYQQEFMLELFKQPKNITGYNAISQDVNGNNLLHLAGKLLPTDWSKIVCEPDIQMAKELAWFKKVEKVVPPSFAVKRNKEGYTPREVFWKEHKSLVEESAKHLKSTAESGMIVSTIILTLMFTAAFTPPGGYDQVDGRPLLIIRRNKWFASFVMFDLFGMLISTYSILNFLYILSSKYEEEQFLSSPSHLRHALAALLCSLLAAISTYLFGFLTVARKNNELYVAFMVPGYVFLVVGISLQFFRIFPRANPIKYYFKKHPNY